MSDDASKKLKVIEAQGLLTKEGAKVSAKIAAAEKALNEATGEVDKLVTKVAELLLEAGGKEATGRRRGLIANAAIVTNRAGEGATKAKGALTTWNNAKEEVQRGILRILSADS